MSAIKVYEPHFEPNKVGGRRLRYDITDVLYAAQDNLRIWISVDLPVKDADSAQRQLKNYPTIETTSELISKATTDKDEMRRLYVRQNA